MSLNTFRFNSIFIRVYLHMLLAMLLVVVLAVCATSLINHVREEQYREELVSGTFYLLSRGWQKQDAADRHDWLAGAGKLLNSELQTVLAEHVALNSWQQRRLQEKKILITQDGRESSLTLYRYLDEQKQLLVKAVIPRLSELHSRGALMLLQQQLRENDQPVADVLSDVSHYFYYPLSIQAADELTLDPFDLRRAISGDVVLAYSGSGSYLKVYSRMGDGRFLIVGPVETFDPYPLPMMLMIALVTLLLSGSGAYLSVRMLEQRLQKVEQAASRIAAGHLSTRVRVNGDDFVAQLARAFNSMAKQVQALLKTQQEMIHAVSHELRTPVARIRFGMQIIEDMVDDPFVKKQLKGIDCDIQELDELVDEILTYARLGQESLSLHYERAQVIPLLKDVVKGLEVLKPDLELKVVHLNPASGEDADIEVRYFQRAVQNLVSNACRYAESQVLVSCYVDPDSIRIDVEDDGPGIPEADWERVFTPFSRLDDSRTRASGGYGLGLSIVRRITYWHQGSALVDRSETLGGARFSLIFPRFRVDVGDTNIV